jgi:hypothetical protein
MNRFALTSALVLVLAAPAFADGKDQLAAQLGVNADSYTLAQLIRLENATESNDAQEVAFVKAQAAGAIVSTQGSATLGNEQLAANVGVDANGYTTAQLVRLERANLENDAQEAAFVKAQAEGRVVSTQGSVTPGNAMLAAIAKVNPADYTTSQLVSLVTSLEP